MAPADDDDDAMIVTDDDLSQFLAFTGTSDPDVARRYLEMAGNNLETAVGLFVDHDGGGANSNAGATGMMDATGGGRGSGGMMGGDYHRHSNSSFGGGSGGGEEVRAPDAARSMRLVGGYDDDDDHLVRPHRRGGGGNRRGGNDDDDDDDVEVPPPALIAALGGPAAREMMRNMRRASAASSSFSNSNRGAGAGGGGGGAMGGGGMMGMMMGTSNMMDEDAMMGRMGGNWASSSSSGPSSSSTAAAGAGAWGRGGRGGGDDHRNGTRQRMFWETTDRANTGGGNSRGNDGGGRRRRDSSDDIDNDGAQVANADGLAMDDDDDDDYNYDDEDDFDDNDDSRNNMGGRGIVGPALRDPNAAAAAARGPPSLSTMFAPPIHLVHRAGGFMGARNFAKDARRWLLANVQSEDDFACHALNRDVWRDELVENLVREGFVLWQATSDSNDGQTYIARYKVTGYPHIAIIDPRTGSLLWRKEGWTQVNPLTAEQFVEIASDFCSRHSFDKLPTAARHTYASGVPLVSGTLSPSIDGGGNRRPSSGDKRPIHELTEEEQLQAAIRASIQGNDDDDDNDNSDVEVIDVAKNSSADDETGQSAFEREILCVNVGDEPVSGDLARVQIRMPDGRRLIRKFRGDDPVKLIYAFVAQSNDDAKAGKLFELKAKFPPQDLFANVHDGIKSCGLDGEAINVIWK